MNPERICFGCFKEKEPGIICPYCGFDENKEKPFLALPLGSILNGRYMVGKVLGIGGFGITYLGYDLTLEIRVAIKEYMPSALATRYTDQYSVVLTGHVEADYKYGMERFLEEARILAKLQNTPNIVSVQNYFKENNTAYFVMEYIEGMSLKEYVASQGDKIPFEQAMTILQPVMEALEQVHALNLLHRDISPDNIYITANGESRLLDFGAARFAAGDGKSVSVILKHGYAPEEQYSSHGNQGPWTDVYAMGATLYRCITGILPPDSIERIHTDTLKKPSELGIKIPANAENAIIKALAIKTENRFKNMSEFLQALTGRIQVQDKISAGITQKTQAAGRTGYASDEMIGRNASGGSRFMTYLKANPVIAWILGGGLAAVIAICIILPITLSGGNKKSGNTADTVTGTPPISQTDPTTVTPGAPDDSSGTSDTSYDPEVCDLGIYSATMSVPLTYEQQENSYTYIDNENQRLVAMVDYMWQLGGPLYSLSDVENNREAVVADLLNQMDFSNDYTILTAGPDSIGDQEAYQIYLIVTNYGVDMDMVIEAVEGQNGFGCYLLLGCYESGDDQGMEEVYDAISSFRCNGKINISYDVISDTGAGVKAICDTSVITDAKSNSFTLPNGNSGTAMLLYFNSDTNQYVEVEEGSAAGRDAGECMEYLCSLWRERAGAELGEASTEVAGGVTWQIQEITYNSYSYAIATADINGKPYIVGMNADEANVSTANSIFVNVISTVRPIS